jgi:putative membrane protein insertion efficiency factor
VNLFADAIWAAGWPLRICLLVLVRGYRVTVGQLTGGNCRFYPSCSEYAETAIAQTGAARGLVLSLWRILRCSPLSKGGVDRPPSGRRWALYDAAIRRATTQEFGR